MGKTCKLKLCIIGSTNFGKSSIAASLIHIAATTDGGIHLLGSPTKILKMADDLRINGQHVATGWDDIEKFIFKLQGTDGRSWRISLRDYPGALFANYVERLPLWERIKRFFTRKRVTTGAHAFDPTAERKAIKLIQKLENADALIVLLPADVADAKYGGDRVIYRQKLPEFIEKVLKKKPHTPVCLCINKWDMFDCDIDQISSKLKESPFADFHQSLKLTCEPELSVAALSAFGGHDPTNPEKIDQCHDQKPINVLETLLVLAEKAEKARYERAVEEWQRSPRWKKMLVAPFKLTSLVRAGSTDSVIRTGLLKMAAKAWGFFGLFVLVVTTLATLTLCVHEKIGFDKLQKRFTDWQNEPYQVNTNNLAEVRDELDRPTLMRKCFFASRLMALRAEFGNIETNYNFAIVSQAVDFCTAEANKDTGAPGNPDDRKKKAQSRKKYLQDILPKLTLSSSIHEIVQRISIEQNLISGNLDPNREFLAVAKQLRDDSDRNFICRKLRSFIDRSKSSHLEKEAQEIFCEFEKRIVNEEGELAKSLDREITNAESKHQGKTAEEKENEDHALVNIIEQYRERFVEGSARFAPFEVQQKKIIDDMKYRKIDAAYDNLDQTNPRTIDAFLKQWAPQAKYPRYEKQFAKLKEKMKSLIDDVQSNLERQVASNGDNADVAATERITACKARIDACRDAADKLVEWSDELVKVRSQKEESERFLKALEDYQRFENKITNLLAGAEPGKIRRIDAFQKTPRGGDYTGSYHQRLLTDLEACKTNLIAEVKKELNAKLTQNAEDVSLSAAEIVRRAENRAHDYQSARDEFIEQSADWVSAKDGYCNAEASCETWRPYIQLEEAFANASNATDRIRLKRIGAFFGKYDRKVFEKRLALFAILDELKLSTEERIANEIETDRQKLREPAMKDFPKWIEYYEKELEICAKYKDYYPTNSESYQNLTDEEKTASEQKEKYVKWNALHNRADEIKRISQDQDQAPAYVLTVIKGFFKDFPSDKYTAAEVEDDIKIVTSIRLDKATEINKQISMRLNSFSLSPRPSETEKQNYYSSVCNAIGPLLTYLEGTDYHSVNQGKWDEAIAKLGKSEKEENFMKEFGKTIHFLKSNADPAVKIERIEDFVARWGADDGFMKEHRHQFGELKSFRKRYESERDWANLVVEKDLNRPDDNDVNAICVYKQSCRDLINKAKPFTEYSYLKDRVREKIGYWQTEEKWAIGKIGDGTFGDILKKENEYKRDPTEENYQILCKAIKGFDSEKKENADHRQKVEAIRKISGNFHRIIENYQNFLNNPSQTTWTEFQSNVMTIQGDSRQSEYPGYPTTQFESAQKILPYVHRGNSVAITLVAWQFRNTRYYRSGDVDCDVWINKDSQKGKTKTPDGDLYCYDVSNKSKEKRGNWQSDDGTYTYGKHKLKLSVVGSCLCQIQFANTDGNNQFSEVQYIDIYRLLVRARKEGECLVEFKDGEASVTLEFSGLPTF